MNLERLARVDLLKLKAAAGGVRGLVDALLITNAEVADPAAGEAAQRMGQALGEEDFAGGLVHGIEAVRLLTA